MRSLLWAALATAGSLGFYAGCSTTFVPTPCTTSADCGAALACVPQANGASICADASGGSGGSGGAGGTNAPGGAGGSAALPTLRIGMSAPITGSNAQLGIEMKKGVDAAFAEQNAKGGVQGHALELDFKDDAYDPPSAEANVRALLDVQDQAGTPPRCPSTTAAGVSMDALTRGPNAVLALLGNVGTPTMVRTAPIAFETRSLFFAPFTGSLKYIRDGSPGPDCAQYAFNVRSSYAQEAHATVLYFATKGVHDPANVISFDQNDTFGDAGYAGLVAAWTTEAAATGSAYAPLPSGDTPFARFRYTRAVEDSVPDAATQAEAYIETLLAATPGPTDPVDVAVFMTDTYGPSARFITTIRDWSVANDADQAKTKRGSRIKFHFSNVSFVGADALAARLVSSATYTGVDGAPHPYTDEVYVSQVVPNYQTGSADGVTSFKAALPAGATPSFTALEGYLDARIFIAGLLAHQGDFTPDALVTTFETALPDLELGLGADPTVGYSSSNHQYSKSVFGTLINADGTFSDKYYWFDGGSLQVND